MDLNFDLANLSRWLEGSINLSLVVFGTHQRLRLPQNKDVDVCLNGVTVKCNDSFKYLGVVLDQFLSFNEHIDYVKKKVSKTSGMLSRVRSLLHQKRRIT